MSSRLVQLSGRWVADDGTIVCSHDALMRLARDTGTLAGVAADPDPRVDRYNALAAEPIAIVTDDGTLVGPARERYEWNTPEPFKSADLADLIRSALVERNLESDERYLARAASELAEIEARDMTGLIRHVAWMVSHWRERGVVWGVGRGSSCASLVLNLVGLHRVDPVELDVPMSEFFR